jgi:hypothetical protein
MAKGQVFGGLYCESIGITGHHRGAAQMVLVIKVAVAGCDLGNTLVTGEYIICLLAVGNLKMITDVICGVSG